MIDGSKASIPRKASVAVIFLISITLELISATTLVCGPTFQRLFHLSKSQLGICLGISSLGILLISPLSGHITY